MYNVLIIRPVRDAQSLANLLKIKNIKSCVFPLFEPRYLPHPHIDNPQALIITSKNAIYALEERDDLKSIPLYVVGYQTECIARNFGFSKIYGCAETGEELTHLILQSANCDLGTLLHLSGEFVTGNIVEELNEKGFKAKREIIYQIDDAQDFPPQLVDYLHKKTLSHVMFFSPRTTSIFVKLLQENGLDQTTSNLTSLCFSKNVAERATSLTWRNIWVSSKPTVEAMIRYFDDK